MTSRRRIGTTTLVLVLAAGAIGGVAAVPASAHVTSAHIASGLARGQAVRVHAGPVTTPPELDDPEVTIDVARAISQIDGKGIDGGTNIADGVAVPLHADTSPAAEITVADSATHAPPSASDSDGVPDAGPLASPLDFFSARALASRSDATAAPSSSNGATVAEAHVTSPVTLDASALDGAASAAGDNGTSQSSAHAHVDLAFAEVLGTTILVEDLDSDATARATGTTAGADPSSAAASCIVKRVTIDGGTPIEPIACDSSSNIDLSPIPIVIEFGNRTPVVADDHTASAGVDALTIVVDGAPVVVLGAAHAAAALARPDEDDGCGARIPRPTASGFARGTVVGAEDGIGSPPGIGHVDVARSDARIDEAGIEGTGRSARADGWQARGTVFGPPADAGLFAAHAAARPDSGESEFAAEVATGILDARALKSAAEASTEGPSSFFRPSAASSTQAAGLELATVPLQVENRTVTTAATSTRSATDVTSRGSAEAETVHVHVPGTLDVLAHGVHTIAEARADGIPGGASTSTHYEIADLQINGTSVVMVPPPPPGTVVEIPGVARITLGVIAEGAAADGRSASASADAIVIESLVPGLDTRIVIGHSEAEAEVPTAAAGFITKDVDVHFDDPSTFGDDGGIAAPHQKITYCVVYANIGTVPLTNVVVSDVLHSRLQVVPPLPAGLTQSGQTVATAAHTLAPGESARIAFMVEVKPNTPLGTVIPNVATMSSSELSPLASNQITTLTAISPLQPALSVSLSGKSFNTTTRVLTLFLRVVNRAGAGKAIGAVVDQIDASHGVTVLDPPPIAVGDILPGTSAPFTVRYQVPSNVKSFIVHFREVGYDERGHRYAFDTSAGVRAFHAPRNGGGGTRA